MGTEFNFSVFSIDFGSDPILTPNYPQKHPGKLSASESLQRARERMRKRVSVFDKCSSDLDVSNVEIIAQRTNTHWSSRNLPKWHNFRSVRLLGSFLSGGETILHVMGVGTKSVLLKCKFKTK